MSVLNTWGKLGLPHAVDTGGSPQECVGENPRVDSKFLYDVAVIGLGPAGLRTLLKHCIFKDRMLGFDLSESRLADVATGCTDLTLLENKRITNAVDANLLKLSSDPQELSKAAVVMICVPVPVVEGHLPDYSLLHKASRTVVKAALPGQLIVLTSTTYAGCTREQIVEPLRERALVPGVDVHVAFSPERADIVMPHPINIHAPRLVGGYTSSCREAAVKFYGRGVINVQRTSGLEAAEMTKLFESAYRAVNTALANEFAQACAVLDIPVAEVLDSANLAVDDALGFTPDSGAGGHELSSDPHYLLWQSRAHDFHLPVLAEAVESNKQRPTLVVDRCARVLADLGKTLAESKILIIGLSNQSDTADLFDSPALAIMSLLRESGADVAYHDHYFPGSITLGEDRVPGYPNPVDFGADLIFLHTKHTYTDLSWVSIADTVIDGTYRVTGILNYVPL